MHGDLPKPNATVTPATGLARIKRSPRWVIYLVVLLAVGGALYYVFGQKSDQQRRGRFFAGDGPVPVLAANAQFTDVPVYLDAVGTTRALNTVTVRSQVDGKLLSVKFKEGQDVKKGDVLAQIDPTMFQAALDQAAAKKAMDESLLANAQNDLARYDQLAATNAINKQQADTQRALVAQYTAQVKSDQAAIESAQATLGYATIRAPIDGRTGLRQVDEGNIVRASDTSGIVVITQLQPISVQFNLPQQYLSEVNAAFAQRPLDVDAQRSDNDAVLDRGKLTVVDNQVDPTTGTVKLKAEFPNADLQLWPGQFANVRLLINTLQHAVTIPTGAVQRGPNGTFVYVIKDGAAAMRPIVVQKQDETQTVVKSGLTPPEQVVTTGFARLTDGAKVTVSDGRPTPAGTAPRAPRPNGTPGANGQQRPNRQQP
ncbi:efflux RND transporter periplasmic adaptor subunit [Undibacter mobilis]|uniref:Efflux RND transporter periplasmic adaptor subunit n=1 Tax=Undibacter mobilis TaxID=2292256 RepID=A0A371B802_9BRAD|nr:efflux RND transporter periplasmic adaptor subunit [Undibacter mobilis]RDV03729.1 efflux RND transporter periplasmic adaptor subunit [Undibacter mobilis]